LNLTKQVLKQVPAQRTGGIVRCVEPFVETSRMEFLFASSARQLWQLVTRAVEDVEADVALLHTVKAFVKVLFPDGQPVDHRAVLVL